MTADTRCAFVALLLTVRDVDVYVNPCIPEVKLREPFQSQDFDVKRYLRRRIH